MSSSATKGRALYDDEPAAPTMADTTPDPVVEDFDAKAFIEGIRPYREATFIYSRGDLVPRARELRRRILATDDKAPEIDALIDEFDALRKEFEAGGRWWEVESRSTDRVLTMRRESAKRRGIDLGDSGGEDLADLAYEDRHAILLDQLAEQIVAPSGVTRDDLQAMSEAADREVDKLLVAMSFVNGRAAQEADVFGMDFSSRRSGNRRARRSSARSK